MKKFKQLFEASAAPAQDYKQKKDDDAEVKDIKPRSKGEEDFVAQHKTEKKNHPVAPDEVHSGDRPKGKKGKTGEDHEGTEEKGEPILKTYTQFAKMGGFGGDSYKGVGKSAGEKAAVMQGSSKVSEEVDLDEGQKPYVSSDRDGKHVMNASGKIVKTFKDMDSANAYLHKHYNKLMKEDVDLDEGFIPLSRVKKYEAAGKKIYYHVLHNGKDAAGKFDNYDKAKKAAKEYRSRMRKQGYDSSGVSIDPYVSESIEFNEAFNAGSLKLKSGETVKLDDSNAKALNSAMERLSGRNQLAMKAEVLKDKKSFEAMIKFAKSVS